MACLLGAGLMAASATQALASEPELYDWPDAEAPLLVRTASGVLFVGKDKKPLRAYSWKANSGARHTPLYLVDLSRNGKPEVLGAGSPTFVLRANSDPAFSLEKGCKQVIVADFVADKKLDVMCLTGKELQIYTDDGQMAWKSTPGKNIDWCRAGDINGDLKADLECKYQGANQYVRIDGNSGQVTVQSTSETEIEDGAIELSHAEPVADKELLEGTKKLDLNGDGSKGENLLIDGKALVIQSSAAGAAPVRIETKNEVIAVFAKDITGDKKLELIALTKSDVFVISEGGSEVVSFSNDAKRYKRFPLADLASVYANGFEDDEQAREAVNKIQDNLSQCYKARVQKNPYTGIGRLLIQVNVDGSGKASGTQQMHSDLGDAQVEKCARDILQKASYPNASGESATLNVNMTYTYRDKE
ncbi:MAG: AgmX/PglI C-terminal domain-containing protein [Bradymonadaceae bacterium]|nr:AgmX/PglI C-terminal domain-containing protein [Lujinxingiaceae bacterium]